MNAYGEMNSLEIGWAQDRLVSPAMDGITIEEVELELAYSPDDPELLQLHTLLTVQSLTSSHHQE